SLTANLGATSSGNALLVAVTWDNSSNASLSIGDSKANSGWTAVTGKQTDTRHSQSMQLFYLPRIASGGDGHTVTARFSTPSAWVRIIVHEVAGLDPAGSLETSAVVNDERGMPVAVGPVSSSTSNVYAFGVVMNDSQPGATTIATD